MKQSIGSERAVSARRRRLLERVHDLLSSRAKKVSPKQAVVDLTFRGVDADYPRLEIIHRGRHKSQTKQQGRWVKRRQLIEPVIGHLKGVCRMELCWLQGALGDALHAALCAVGYNLR